LANNAKNHIANPFGLDSGMLGIGKKNLKESNNKKKHLFLCIT
jgi:hypothetical protein